MCFPNVMSLEWQREKIAIILKVVRNKYHHEDEDISMSLLTHTPNSHVQKWCNIEETKKGDQEC